MARDLVQNTEFITVTGQCGTPGTSTILIRINADGGDGEKDILTISDGNSMRLKTTQLNPFYHHSGGFHGFNSTISDPIGDGLWHTAAFVNDPGSSLQEAFWDGSSIGTDSENDAIDYTGVGSDTLLGQHGNGANRRFDGDIADAAVWNIVLPDTHLAVIHKGVPPFVILHDNLELYLPILGKDSPEVDYSGNGRTGALTGATASNHPPVEMIENYL